MLERLQRVYQRVDMSEIEAVASLTMLLSIKEI
jgi:hypothetical protein